jgi:hypothetical protein
MYILSITFPKLTMICLFLKIFVEKWQRIAYITVGLILIGTAIGDFVANVLQCIPLKTLWEPNTPGGSCFDQNAYWRWGSFPNIITDILLIVLPLPAMWKLQMSWKDKLGVTLTLATGGM